MQHNSSGWVNGAAFGTTQFIEQLYTSIPIFFIFSTNHFKQTCRMEKFRATSHKYDSQGRFIITLSRNEKLGSALRQWISATRSHWMRAWARSVRWPSLSRMPNYLHWSQTTSKQLFWADKHINFTTKSARCVRALYQVRTTFTSDVVRAVPMWENYTLTHPDTHIHARVQ